MDGIYGYPEALASGFMPLNKMGFSPEVCFFNSTMSTVSISTSTSQSMSVPTPDTAKDPFAGMTLLTAEGQQPRAKAAIEITKNALKRIRVAMAKEGISPDAGGLRVGIQGGGCSGLSYNIRFDTQPRERDRTFTFGEGIETPNDPSGATPVRLFVDPKSFLYLAGMVLDFEETLMRQGFNFINPNSTKSCGCGSSFSA
jgi:iron-sulfur cluster assembly protein